MKMKKIVLFTFLICMAALMLFSCNKKDGKITVTDETEPELETSERSEPSVGLSYQSNGDGTCSVTGMGTCGDTAVVIPEKSPAGDTVTAIADSAFSGVSAMKSVSIPDTVTSIGKNAFCECVLLSSAKVPASVTSIGYGAFNACRSLRSIEIPFVGGNQTDSDKAHFGYIFGAGSYENNGKFVPGYLKSVVLSDGCESIAAKAFYGCASLGSIQLPKTMKTIGESAFEECPALNRVNYPYTIADWCKIDFANQTANPAYITRNLSLVTDVIEIPEDVEEIHDYAFAGMGSVTEIIIPSTVKSVGKSAFEGPHLRLLYR